ncbi:MAG: hypothetical protein LBG73_07080 [Spirochaetaceae bacterium]|jgi:hypothetical protein|nr:hypothetical protein [Spirochaetaceae bacterium]
MPITEAVREEIEMDADWECPICGKNPKFNAETIAAAEECRAMRAGKIPFKRYHSIEELREELGV